MKLPQLSIATKLYAIFALLATATVALAISAVVNASYHAALVEEFGAAFKAGQHVERINALINALVMETRGIYLAEEATTAESHGRTIGNLSEKVTQALEGWQQAAPDYTPWASTPSKISFNPVRSSSTCHVSRMSGGTKRRTFSPAPVIISPCS